MFEVRPIYQFEQECQAELDRLAQRRQVVMEDVEALSKELVSGISRCRDAGMSMIDIAQRLGISRQRAYMYLRAGHRRPVERSQNGSGRGSRALLQQKY